MDNKERLLNDIVEKYDTDGEIISSEICSYNDIEYLFPRLKRAALNHVIECDNPGMGAAMFSRYRIWADTIRGVLEELMDQTEGDTTRSIDKKNLIKVVNSLSAFCEIQNLIDR